MPNYRLINNLCGWLSFAISAFVYISTLEPTGSFWDCGEFIASSYKLQVGHPPGAPLFMMMGRIMSLFAGGDVEAVSVMINLLSALMSAGTILFLFWTITILARKILVPKGDPDMGNTLAIMGAGLVGALAYTFSDSFWFSAVEGEVYASSSFFTAIVFWAMFKWEAVADERHGNRWIILIAYLMGLSIGVHLLNLLTIPALAFIYYFRKYTVTTNGLIKTAAAGVLILAVVQYGIISGFVKFASKFELFFVNGLGLPFWSGFVFFFLLIAAGIVYGLNYTRQRNMPMWNLSLLCLTFILVGYSSYAMIVLRSNANPPMDENDPEHAFNLLGYINREQYGDRPLFYGQYYNADQVSIEEGSMQYTKGEDGYTETSKKLSPVYDPKFSTIFPRMYSAQENHISAYKEWGGIRGDGKPTFAQNLKFFWNYQVVHMYWRYFMWNFAGRQNDIQGHGGITKGNWISGIKGIDEMRLGPQNDLPENMRNNKAHNTFYFLPLILGLIGLVWHYRRDNHDAWTVMLLFFFTGLAIVLYLNQYPYQPRERDYAYAASFYTFAIWIGLGVTAIIDRLRRTKAPMALSAVATTLACLVAVPGIMASQGWDDHNRAGRFTSRDIAWNYLQSCAPNAIIFTNGDNDTFPLWYAQDVEGIRTDVRVVNLSLLNTDWYIDQMKRKAYESAPVPFMTPHEKYVQGTRDYVPFYDKRLPGYSEAKDVMKFVNSEGPEYKVQAGSGAPMSYFPTQRICIKVDKEAVLRNGVVKPEDADRIVDTIYWDLTRNYLMKADLMILDLIAHNDWTRPIYFAVTVGNDSYLNLEPYFQLEGLAYRFVPIRNSNDPQTQTGRVQSSVMYDNMMNKFRWGNIDKPEIYLDQNNLNMTMNFRNNFARLADGLIEQGRLDSAMKCLDRMNKEIPDATVPYNVMMLRPIEQYFQLAQGLQRPEITPDGKINMRSIELPEAERKRALESAKAITLRMADHYEDELQYYFSLKRTPYIRIVDREYNQAMAIFNELLRIAKANNAEDLVKNLEPRFRKLEQQFTGA
jgi:uncharacterized membrane protein